MKEQRGGGGAKKPTQLSFAVVSLGGPVGRSGGRTDCGEPRGKYQREGSAEGTTMVDAQRSIEGRGAQSSVIHSFIHSQVGANSRTTNDDGSAIATAKKQRMQAVHETKRHRGVRSGTVQRMRWNGLKFGSNGKKTATDTATNFFTSLPHAAATIPPCTDWKERRERPR
eukprot:GHVU01037312.1.p1 GENE.GHVU01037312.1~~GHVU01037312.1.p1  ORF type:complete len:169 (+),score=24.07 GHVU01037312.1:228-734(+)